MRKKLIVSGCSFTTSNYKSTTYPEMNCDWPKWPELLAEKLDMDCVNLAFSGAGNHFIFQTIMDTIIRTPRDEIGMVIAAWSQANREDWQYYRDTLKNKMMYNETHMKGFVWHNERLNKKGDVFSWVRSDIIRMITLQKLCEALDIPFKQLQMVNLFDGYISGLVKTELELKSNPENIRHKYLGDQKEDRKKCNAILLEYEDYINKDNFLGWPGNERMGGLPFSSLVDDIHYQIGKHDPHPNKLGHEKIAKEIYGRLG